MPHIRLGFRLSDEDLFEATAESYRDAVDRGEMSLEEVEANLKALAEGMLECTIEPTS